MYDTLELGEVKKILGSPDRFLAFFVMPWHKNRITDLFRLVEQPPHCQILGPPTRNNLLLRNTLTSIKPFSFSRTYYESLPRRNHRIPPQVGQPG
jgi:hypothetical protein